ncbi:MAG: putative DNA binding domain-containing protein [Thermomicrobiales bacterium]|nr:putative DNA binding domain-containing protein [Thermomicrobiales bacterium]
MAWRRVDLHLHTPASCDYQDPHATALDMLRRAEEQGLDIVAFTDHNSVRGYADMWREIEDLELLEYLKRLESAEAERLHDYRRLLGSMLVLPGFEFTATFGFHILAIFPEGTSVRLMEHLLLLLGVPEERFGSGEVGATSDVLRAYEVLAAHGALVIGAHVNSTHGVAMQGLRFGGQTKIAYTQDEHLHALEATDLALGPHRRSTARFFNGSKPEYPRRMHVIQGSDAHRLTRDPQREMQPGIGDRATEALLPAASFAALKELFQSDDFERTRPYVPAPADPVKAARIEGNTEIQVFHESLTTKRTGMNHVLRDIVGLANRSGGVIFVGASASEKRPIPGIVEPETAIAELSAEIVAQITPSLPVTIDTVESDGKTVLALTIEEGAEKPYALAPGAILVRGETESTPATRDEIVAMVTDSVVRPQPVAAPEPAAPPTPSPNGRSHNGRQTGQRDRRENQTPPRSPVEAVANTVAALDVVEEEVAPDPAAPTSGVEVVHAYEQDGVVYYTLRDLKSHHLVHNVTRDTDRRLWRSAISQYEDQPVDEEKVRWQGDLGLWRTYRPRGGERRYNLVYRGDGDLRVFYGVSEVGMRDGWSGFLPQPAAH